MRGWFLEARRFLSLQLVIMAVNLAVGLLVLRFLDKADYALYTIGFATLFIFTDISAAGVGPAVQSLAGARWRDRGALGALVRTAISFRKTVALALGLPILAYGFWQYNLIGAGVAESVALLAVFGVAGVAALEVQIFKTPLKYHHRVADVQGAEMWAAIVKLAGVVAFGFVAPDAVVFGAISTGAFVVEWALTRRHTREVADLTAPTDPAVRARIVELFKPSFPSVTYWAFQSQITILLCSLFGTIENVAEIGALGKLALMFQLLNVFVGSYLHPAISKASRPGRILRMSAAIIAIYMAACLVVVGIAAAYPEAFLLILGERYANLDSVLVLAVAVSMLSLLEGQIMSLCQVRGWVRLVGWYVVVAVATQATLLLTMELTGLRDILVFNGVVVLATLTFVSAIFAYEFSSYRTKVHLHALE